MKALLFLLGIIFSQICFGQSRKFYGEIHVESIIYKNDTLRFPTPKIITIKELGTSGFIAIGKIKTQEFGLKVEYLVSKLSSSESIICGKAFFIKEKRFMEGAI